MEEILDVNPVRKIKRWQWNSRADLSPLGSMWEMNIFMSSLLLPWIKNNCRAFHLLPRAHTQGSTTSCSALGTKRDPEITELMGVGKSCKRSIYTCRVLFCPQLPDLRVFLDLSRLLKVIQGQTMWRHHLRSSAWKVLLWASLLHVWVVSLTPAWPWPLLFQEYESNGWVISGGDSAVSSHGGDWSFTSLEARTGHFFS